MGSADIFNIHRISNFLLLCEQTEAATGGVLKSFANFYRKTPMLESLLNKVADLQLN